jgi:CelD/BcsL family acetyltransferase involved in cellulose biosynthesis
MIQAAPAALDAQLEVEAGPSLAGRAAGLRASASPSDIRLTIHEDLAACEREWRAFERRADCTVFQSFDWLSTWQRHIGARSGVSPVIVVGRGADGEMLFLMPLAIDAHGFARRLTWLGSDLCDYNAPLLAKNLPARMSVPRFVAVWREILERLQSHPRMGFDLIDFVRMPQIVGAQRNPFMQLRVVLHPSGAYLTQLTDDWEKFYAAKRSSETRRRDRTKRKKLGEMGEVRFVNPDNTQDIAQSFAALMQQKVRLFANMGVANIFARPGYPEFYRELATRADTRALVHISRLDVGPAPAAVNLGLVFQGCYYHVLASYDDGAVSRFGPGAAHLHELMRYAIERGCRVFDFTVGDERYKRDWYDTELKLFDYVSAARVRGFGPAVMLAAMRRVKRWIKQTPVAWSAFTRMRGLLGALRKAR